MNYQYEPKYIIVQAGGKGTRLKEFTRNKPKALTSINNLPMIFHLFKRYPKSKFVIIGDYKYDVLIKYLDAFAEVDFQMIDARGKNGTCAGLSDAVKYIPNNENFMVIWSDLILEDDIDEEILPQKNNYIGISRSFKCRWSYNNKSLQEVEDENGVAGLFIFKSKNELKNLPENGEFVKYLRDEKINFEPLILKNVKEYGLFELVNNLETPVFRPFNSIKAVGNHLIKKGIDAQGIALGKREVAWYKNVKDLGFKNLPKIYDLEPLEMEKIDGATIYSYKDISLEAKEKILKDIVDCLNKLHNIDNGVSADFDSFYEAYIGKTLKRLEKVKELVPFAKDEFITINNVKCKNVFYCLKDLENAMEKYIPKEFKFIHGDCTFSNILLENQTNRPILIDPRGYFGNTELYGDVAYDWAKLFYSLYGNYDQFNLRNFDLIINDKDIILNIESNGWEETKDYFIQLVSDDVCFEQLKLIHALIWLSLTTYAWDNYDSICGAFYNGVYLLNQCDFIKSNHKLLPYFENTINIIEDSVASIDPMIWNTLINECVTTLKNGGKIIASGLGKNAPVCEKFVGTLNSFGLDARFLNTNTAMHGDLGMVKSNDIVFVLSKTGNTEESVALAYKLNERNVNTWLFSFNKNCILSNIIDKHFILDLRHEGDMRNIAPNNSVTVFLIVLQGLAVELSKILNISLADFQLNHPHGGIGKILNDKKDN